MGFHWGGSQGGWSDIDQKSVFASLSEADHARGLSAISSRNESALAKEILAARSPLTKGSPPRRLSGGWLAAAAAEGWEAGVAALLPVSDLGHLATVDWSARPYVIRGSRKASHEYPGKGRSGGHAAENSHGGWQGALDKYGRSPNIFGEGRKVSALGLACLNGHEECARLIFDAWKTGAGRSAWLPKSALARNEIAQRGAGGGRDEGSAVSWAARCENVKMLAILLAIGAAAEEPGKEPALLAAFGEKQQQPREAGVEALRLLILAGANKEARSSSPGLMGMTPLGVAAIRGWPNVAKMLVESGARVDAKDAQGRGVLMLALAGSESRERLGPGEERRSRAELAKMLLSAGADANAEPRRWTSGMATPLMVAIGQGNEQAAKAIEERLAAEGVVGAREAATKSLACQDLWGDDDYEGPASESDKAMWDDWDDELNEYAAEAAKQRSAKAKHGEVAESPCGKSGPSGGMERLAAARTALGTITGQPTPQGAPKSCGPRR